MTANVHEEETTTAIQVACDTAVSGCVFKLRTEENDKERLLEITRDHVAEQHGKEFTLEEIDEQHVETVDVSTARHEH